jgi:hypothetical protein
MSYTETHIIQLSSMNATLKNNGSYLSNVIFSLQGLLKRDSRIINKRISVLHAQFPLTIYAVNDNNNKFKYQIDTGSIFTITIPKGNYNATSLIETLNSLFAINSTIFNITFSQITGLISFNYTSNFTFYQVEKSIMTVLGFQNINYTSVSNSLTAPYPLNILGALNFQIYSSQLLTKNYNSIQKGQSTLLATIPINTITWGVASYDNNTNIRNILYNDVINNIDIQIYDNLGNLIDFNNNDWEITLVLDIEYNSSSETKPLEKELNNLNTNISQLTDYLANLNQPPDTPQDNQGNQGNQVPLEDNLDTQQDTPIETTDMELYLLSR